MAHAEEAASGLTGKQAASGSGPSCQVEGCDRGLSVLSAYHQKCRICDVHIKAPSFVRAGLVQRFCQRCGRCHELDAFEGTRRSCRAQLAKHNARYVLHTLLPCIPFCMVLLAVDIVSSRICAATSWMPSRAPDAAAGRSLLSTMQGVSFVVRDLPEFNVCISVVCRITPHKQLACQESDISALSETESF